jgi:PST family polysaccharide transporter
MRNKVNHLRASLVSQAMAKVFQLAASICIGGLTARYLGPTLLGKLSYVAAIVGMLSPLGSLGTKESLSALLCSVDPAQGLVSSAFIVQLVGTTLTGLLIIPIAYLSGDDEMKILYAFAVGACLLSSFEVFGVQLLNKNEGEKLAKVDTWQTLAGSSFSILLLVTRAPLIGFGILPTVQAGLRAILLWRASCIRSFREWLASADIATCKVLIARGLPLVMSGFTIMIYMKSDQVMLEWIKGSYAVGQYSVAVRVAESIYFLPVVLSQTYAPRLGKYMAEEHAPEDQLQIVKKFYKYAWMLGISMVGFTALILPVVLVIVYGKQYEQAVIPLICLAPAVFAVATGTATGAWLNIKGYVDILFWRTGIGAILNIILNIALIPKYGITGAAIATSISQLFASHMIESIDSRTRENHQLIIFPFR